MTLTYRGKKYVQLQGAGFDATKEGTTDLSRLVIHEVSSRVHVKQPRLEWGFFIALDQLHKRMVPSGAGNPFITAPPSPIQYWIEAVKRYGSLHQRVSDLNLQAHPCLNSMLPLFNSSSRCHVSPGGSIGL